MKFLTLALATVAAATSVEKRDVVFKVRDFAASCVPHSAMCNYSFNVLQPGTMDTTGVECTGAAPGAGVAVLPDIPAGTCHGSSRTFKVERTDKGLLLTVSVQVSPISYTKGSHLIPNDQIQVQKGVTPTGDVQAYTGPKDFDLEHVD